MNSLLYFPSLVCPDSPQKRPPFLPFDEGLLRLRAKSQQIKIGS